MNSTITITRKTATLISTDRTFTPPYNPYGRGCLSSPKSKEKNSTNLYRRNLKTVKGLIEMNITDNSYYVTFTINKSKYPTECFDAKFITDKFKRFIEKFKKKLSKLNSNITPKFIRFLHLGSDKTFHLHVIFFSDLYLTKYEIEELWKLGTIHLDPIKKYMKKKNIENYNGLAYYGLKHLNSIESLHIYSPSKGLEKPISISLSEDSEIYTFISNELKQEKKTSKNEYQHKFLGKVEQLVYDIQNDSNKYFNLIDNGEI